MALQQTSHRQSHVVPVARPPGLVEDERRWATRKPCATSGLITSGQLSVPAPCIIRDMSTTGARLEVREAGTLPGSKLKFPSTFRLLIRNDRVEVDCAIQWRRGGDLGVRFLAAPHALPRPVR